GKQYFRGELSDIFWRRNGDLRIPATQPVDGSAFKVYDPKRRLKQEAGEHTGGHNHPFGSGLAAQQPSDLVLLIEHWLSAAASHHVIIDTELPRKVPPDACREYRAGNLQLRARPGNEARAIHHRPVAPEQLGQR